MASVVIAAHDESAVIARTLTTLLADADPAELDVTVVANGCSDDTASVAGRFPGVRVVELTAAGKARALNAGDAAAEGYPRVYLDADIAVGVGVVRALLEALTKPGILVAFPGRRLDLAGRPLLVRCYFAVHGRLPVFRTGVFGRGMIAVSQAGRERFAAFPELIADDLFLDSLYTIDERAHVPEVWTTVATPLRTRDLVRRLERVRRGNAQLRREYPSTSLGVRPPDRWSWLRDVVVRRPWLFPAGLVYVAITTLAAMRARRSAPAGQVWGRDESTRG